MAALRILPDLEQVVVEICDMWEEERQRLLTDLKDIAAKQSGRWKLVVEE
jgi:thioredoxin-like negative regulator of GroEL